jgi:cytochrome c oxidase subunit 3
MIDSGQITRGGPVRFAMTLMILSLTVLFAASLVGYWITRGRIDGVDVTVPALLWYSTAALLISGLLISLADRRLYRGAAPAARTHLRLATAASVAFLALQIPALIVLLQDHRTAAPEGNPLIGFVFFLVLLHALHVVGGVIALGAILYRVRGRSLSADQDGSAVRQTARYWHFLDIVWLVMFATFLLG